MHHFLVLITNLLCPVCLLQIQDGTIDKEEFDFVLSTPDILPDLLPIRTILKDKFPAKNRGEILLVYNRLLVKAPQLYFLSNDDNCSHLPL